MRSAQSLSIDFNQMLVVSVFFHFFLFTVAMFLPHAQNMVKRIKPAFMVSLINVPTGPEARPAPPVQEATVESESQTPSVVEKPVPKKSEAAKALVSKLDQLAKLERKVPAKKVVVPNRPILDDTFLELESLKKKVIPKKNKTAMVAPAPMERFLEGFEDIKMKTQVEKKKKLTRKQIAKQDLSLKELEFDFLSKQKVVQKQQSKPKKPSNLFKELEDLAQLNKQTSAALDPPKVKKPKPNSKTARLLKELESIRKERVQLKIDASKLSSRYSRKFKSSILNSKKAGLRSKTAGSAVSGEPGDPAATALAIYMGLVQNKVDENWRDPLGAGQSNVVVSFRIFPRGNITMPTLVKRSGDGRLDNLALLAIKNAAPFPPFPKEIKEPSLPFTINFEYVHKKTQ